MSMLETVRTRSTYFWQINLYFIIKRLADIVISFLLIVLLLPFILLIAYFLYRKEGRPIFTQQIRTGKQNRLFSMWKFRTTTIPTKVIRAFPPHPFPKSWEKGVPNTFTFIQNDKKLYTPTGFWLEKRGIDKLPLLINVLKGDLSFVGPSPEIPEITDFYNRYQMNRLKVKPGLTGYAQIKGVTSKNHDSKIEYDLYYIQQCSLLFDLKILFTAFKLMVTNFRKK